MFPVCLGRPELQPLASLAFNPNPIDRWTLLGGRQKDDKLTGWLAGWPHSGRLLAPEVLLRRRCCRRRRRRRRAVEFIFNFYFKLAAVCQV